MTYQNPLEAFIVEARVCTQANVASCCLYAFEPGNAHRHAVVGVARGNADMRQKKRRTYVRLCVNIFMEKRLDKLLLGFYIFVESPAAGKVFNS